MHRIMEIIITIIVIITTGIMMTVLASNLASTWIEALEGK